MLMERLKDLIAKNYENNKVENSNKILNKARKEVEINGNGTTGYKLKSGRVLKHIMIPTKNL